MRIFRLANTELTRCTMSIAESIAPHLPYLRRYARSLTGSQQSGDNYVAAVLEALIADFGRVR